MSKFPLPEKKFYDMILRLLKEKTVYPKNILELDPHSAELLKLFPSSSIAAITPEEQQYNLIKEESPSCKCYRQTLTGFRVAQQSQLVVARGGRMNEFSTIAQLKKVFQKCTDHLDPFGILIFDWWTPNYFTSKIEQPQTVIQSDTSVSILDYTKKGKVFYKSETTFFEKEGGMYERKTSDEKQITLSISDLKKLCESHFESMICIDPVRKSPSKHSEYLVVACQKGWDGIKKK